MEGGVHGAVLVDFAHDDAFLLLHFIEGVAHEAATILDGFGLFLCLLRPMEMTQGGVVEIGKYSVADPVIAADREGPLGGRAFAPGRKDMGDSDFAKMSFILRELALHHFHQFPLGVFKGVDVLGTFQISFMQKHPHPGRLGVRERQEGHLPPLIF